MNSPAPVARFSDCFAELSPARVGALLAALENLTAIGAALSQEKDIDRLLEAILDAAKEITQADGGTLYRQQGEGELSFSIVRTDSLGLRLGGTTGRPVPFAPVPLKLADGSPNHSTVVAWCALTGQTVNIADAYREQGFDFSGTRAFDARTGYRSVSFLTVPLRDHENALIGVLQLINRRDPEGHVGPFSDEDRRLAEALASQAAIALTNRLLIGQLETLFESLVKLINTAIDEKSPYTGGHCERVPVLTMLLADAASETAEGALADFRLSEHDRYELKIAALLHDCGKITTPVHVVDKATKLQTIFDRIELIDTRFEVARRDAEIALLKAQAAARAANNDAAEAAAAARYRDELGRIEDDRAFLHHANLGAERMPEADRARVREIAARPWRDAAGNPAPFLSEDEVANLAIPYGTLTQADRDIINHHIVATINMLEALPWPRHLKNVPEYAGGHHERMDGRGYPRGLRREQMSVQARIMGIADIFEALTAKDRPYKRGKTLSESLAILGKFALNGHIDPDLFDVFIRRKVYLRYAEQFLDPAQIDAVDETKIPGYGR